MRLLHLIRHAQTQPTPGLPGPQWLLTPEGHTQARLLAEQLPELSVSRVITSTESKAIATGRAIAQHLGLPLDTRPGLEEHGRLTVSATATLEEFHAGMARLFAHPDQCVFGDESADAARERFTHALDALMGERDEDALVVSHGTVISLLVAHANDLDARAFWQRVAMPDHLVLEWPTYRLLRHAHPRPELPSTH